MTNPIVRFIDEYREHEHIVRAFRAKVTTARTHIENIIKTDLGALYAGGGQRGPYEMDGYIFLDIHVIGPENSVAWEKVNIEGEIIFEDEYATYSLACGSYLHPVYTLTDGTLVWMTVAVDVRMASYEKKGQTE